MRSLGDLDALRLAAAKASAGPWRIQDGHGGSNSYSGVVDAENRQVATVTIGDNGRGREDLDYITLANPATVLALLDRLEGLT